MQKDDWQGDNQSPVVPADGTEYFLAWMMLPGAISFLVAGLLGSADVGAARWILAGIAGLLGAVVGLVVGFFARPVVPGLLNWAANSAVAGLLHRVANSPGWRRTYPVVLWASLFALETWIGMDLANRGSISGGTGSGRRSPPFSSARSRVRFVGPYWLGPAGRLLAGASPPSGSAAS